MAITATIALSASTARVGAPVTVTVTVADSASSNLSVAGITPHCRVTGKSDVAPPSCAFGMANVAPGSTVAIPNSSNISFKFNAVFYAPSTGDNAQRTNTYDVYCSVYLSDGTEIVAGTPATISVNPRVVVGEVDYTLSTAAFSNASVVSGSTRTITLTAKDGNGNQLPAGGLPVSFSLSGGVSTGTIGSVTDNLDGTYTATVTGVLAGSATSLVAKIRDKTILSAAATLTVTPGAVSLSQSVVTRASATVVSGATNLCTLTAKDAAGNQLAAGGLTILFSHTGGVSTGTFGSVTDVGDGTYTADFTGVLAGSATSIASTIGGAAVTSAQPTISVTPGIASAVTSLITVSNSTVVSGATRTTTLTAKDAAGNLCTSGGRTVAFATSGGDSTLTFAATTDVGDGTYTSVTTGVLAGSATTITSTINAVAVSSSPAPTMAVTVGAANKLVMVTEPVGAAAASPLATQPVVKITDAAGNITTSGADVVAAIATNPSAGTLSGTATIAASSGTATFTNLQIDNAGVGYTLEFTSAGLTSVTSAAFTMS